MKATNFLMENSKFNLNSQGGLLNRMNMKNAVNNSELKNMRTSGLTASPILSNISIDGSQKNEIE
jgi:hypothetical protein